MAPTPSAEVDSAPHLNSRLRGNGQITGGFTEDDAKKLAAVLQAGKLREKPILVSERTIAAELAGSARDRGVYSTLIAFAVVLAMMVYFYYGPGLLANLALLMNLVLLVGVLSWFEAVLTLPGIAGVVLTVGMAVDANILVFERIKEEKSKGRTISQAVETGYDRALVTIVDANLTTLITAYFLFQIGSGPVRGFGITLAIGILVSMFTALFVTRTFFTWLMQKGVMTEVKMNGEYNPPKINWMGHKKNTVTFSAILMLVGALLWEAVPATKKYDLDFSEGSRLIVRFHEATAKADVESKIASLAEKNADYSDVAVRVSAEGIGAAVATDEGRVFEIRSQKISSEEEIAAFKNDLRDAFAGKLMPGPFRATLKASGARTTGQLTFRDDAVNRVWVYEAIDSYSRAKNILRDPQLSKVTGVAGAGSAFDISFSDPFDMKGDIDLATDKALKAFDSAQYESVLIWLEDQATLEGNTEEQKKAFAARAAALKAAPLPEAKPELFQLTDPLPSADRVDPFTARQHRDAAVRAIAFSIIGIVLYVAFRFRSWAFGFAAVVALVHDVLVVLGIIALTNLTGIVDARLNLVTVAAFLTLIGYSINDTIVVFDRIRENRGTGRARLEEILNKSINQTFRRTIRTTTTTWIVVSILFAFNIGSSSPLEGFAFILMIGVLVGTYSSIFIASPTLIYLPWLWEQSGSTVK
ncbi:MAG: protein translocase subunit SecD, partial [Planctomycetota bacterium]